MTGTSESEDDTVEVEVSDGTTTLTQTSTPTGGAFSASFTAGQVEGCRTDADASARSTDVALNQGPVGTDTATKDTVSRRPRR